MRFHNISVLAIIGLFNELVQLLWKDVGLGQEVEVCDSILALHF